MASSWQDIKRLTVPHGGTATFTLPHQAPLERLTIWAISGPRTITNMSFQPKINGANYGAAVTVVGAVAAKIVLSSGGATSENNLIPYTRPDIGSTADPFTMTVVVSNAGANDEDITLMAVALQHFS